MTSEYQRRLGEKLRAMRQQQQLTLQQVEDKSQGRWKAVVVGSYERGDRAVSVSKLAELASFYGVPVAELLPETSSPAPLGEISPVPRVIVDLSRLSHADESDSTLWPVSRFVNTIQMQRGDYNGRMLTLRSDDVKALAIVLGMDPDALLNRLEERGLLVRQAA